MLFRSVATCIVGVLFTQGALAALTPARLVTSIEAVTAASKDANTALVSISTSTKVADVKTSGKVLSRLYSKSVYSYLTISLSLQIETCGCIHDNCTKCHC